jgi:hypothetical protein
VPAEILNHQGWAAVRMTPSKTGDVHWEVQFAPADAFHFLPSAPENLWLERVGLDGVNVHWREQYYLNAGYQVYLNGQLLGCSPTASFPIRNLDPLASYTVEVKTVAENGVESRRGAESSFSIAPMTPAELSLTQLEPVQIADGARGFEIDDQLTHAPLLLGGKRHEAGLGTFVGSEMRFDLKGLFDKFTTLAGMDDASGGRATADFVIMGDGRELWRSGPLNKADAPKAVEVNIIGVHELTLRSIEVGDGQNRAQADWAETKVSRASP